MQQRRRQPRAMSGLGLMEATATGVRFGSAPACVTPAEREEARRKCGQLRGLGAISKMTGRLAPFDPCGLVNLPDCQTPGCLDVSTTKLLEDCIAGRNPNPEFDCGSLYAAGLLQLPFCRTPSDFPILGSCLQPGEAAVRDYCAATNAQGPDRAANAACWRLMHARDYWNTALRLPVCGPSSPPYAPPAYTPPPPGYTPPPAYTPPPSYLPPDSGGGPDDGATGPESSESTVMGMWGILGLVAAGGAGYYLYRKYKK